MPEALFRARSSLPSDIVKTYVQVQEHFDATKLIANLPLPSVQSLPAAETLYGEDAGTAISQLVTSPVTKTVLFTRTSNDLLELRRTDEFGSVADGTTGVFGE